MKRRSFFKGIAAVLLGAPAIVAAARVPPMGITVVNGRLPQDQIEKLEQFKRANGIGIDPPLHPMCRCVPTYMDNDSIFFKV